MAGAHGARQWGIAQAEETTNAVVRPLDRPLLAPSHLAASQAPCRSSLELYPVVTADGSGQCDSHTLRRAEPWRACVRPALRTSPLRARAWRRSVVAQMRWRDRHARARGLSAHQRALTLSQRTARQGVVAHARQQLLAALVGDPPEVAAEEVPALAGGVEDAADASEEPGDADMALDRPRGAQRRPAARRVLAEALMQPEWCVCVYR